MAFTSIRSFEQYFSDQFAGIQLEHYSEDFDTLVELAACKARELAHARGFRYGDEYLEEHQGFNSPFELITDYEV